MVSQRRIVFFVQPENQFLRQCNALSECLSLLEKEAITDKQSILVVGLHDETIAHTERFQEKMEVEFDFHPIPQQNSLVGSKFESHINKNDLFLLSGTKLQQSWYLAQWARTALQLVGPLTMIHEHASGLEMDKLVVKEDRNGVCSAELSTMKRSKKLDLVDFMTDKGYKFDRYRRTELSENQKRIKKIEEDVGLGEDEGVEACDGVDFEVVIADALHRQNEVNCLLMNVMLETERGAVAREEDIACSLVCGINLFLSCKFGRSMNDPQKIQMELKRLSEAAVSRNLQPKERWRVGLALRQSHVEAAKKLCEVENYQVLIISVSNLKQVIQSISVS